MSLGETERQLSITERFSALNRVGIALMREHDESRLLHFIAKTACDFTGAQFAAFSLRPIDEMGQPLVPSEGNLFYLAAVVGVTKEQEVLLRHMPLGGEGLLAPIFRHGVPVLVADALSHIAHSVHTADTHTRDVAREAAFAYAHGQLPVEELRSIGVPHGHPLVRSFLGAPLLGYDKQVRGGLFLGHTEPHRFTAEDESVLVGLAAQAAVALENARLYRTVQARAQELDAIFESIADGVLLVDSQGHILRENEVASRLRRDIQEHPEGKRILDKLLYEPVAATCHDEKVQDSTVTVKGINGEVKEYLVTTSHLRYTTSSPVLVQHTLEETTTSTVVSGVVVVWRDVTERRIREAERAAREQARLLQLILDGLPSSVYLVRGKDAELVLANRAAATVWGATWPKGQTIASFLEENGIRIFGTDGRPLDMSQLATMRALHHGVSVYQHQETIRHPDGTSLPVLVNAVAIKNQELSLGVREGKSVLSADTEPMALVVHQDVTALKEAERLKDEFIGLAAHELRTPLAVLKGFAQTLIVQTGRGKGPALADWQMEALKEIDQSTTRMVELTEDLLDVTRLQAGRLELQIEPLNLIPLVQRLVNRIQTTTEQHHISLHYTSQHLVVQADARRIEQILNNLLGNAMKYSPEGGPIHVFIRQDNNMAVISIQDVGIGIPAHQQALIFSRFVRAENAEACGIGGTGLGLYLCRELVERQAGRIWFESCEGEGSTFYVTLPLLKAEQSSSPTNNI